MALLVDLGTEKAVVFSLLEEDCGLLREQDLVGFFFGGFGVQFDRHVPFLHLLPIRLIFLLQKSHLCLFVFLLFGPQCFHRLDHVDLVETLIFHQTVDLFAEGLGLCEDLFAIICCEGGQTVEGVGVAEGLELEDVPQCVLFFLQKVAVACHLL